MTLKQREFILKLLDDCGYKSEEMKNKFFEIFFKYDNIKIDYTSSIIERLIKEKKLSKSPMKLRPTYDFVSISNLAAFEFCPVSYCIQETFDIKTSAIIEEGLEKHKPIMLERLINSIKSNSKFKAQLNEDISNVDVFNFKSIEEYMKEIKRKEDKNRFYTEVLNSEIILKSHIGNVTPIFNSSRTICGIPDYLFKKRDGENFVVDERHTYRSEIIEPWPSHILQLAGYIIGFKTLLAEYGYIVYFHLSNKTDEPIYNSPTVFFIQPKEKERTMLQNNYKKVFDLKNGKVLKLGGNDIYFHKCIKCSLRYYCGHKSGTINKLIYPYHKN